MAENPIKNPLPADLPEDWNAGQTVAPDGTTVGLTEQHGYNYLMQMVNRSQRGVNTLNEAFGRLPSSDRSRLVVGTSTNGWTRADCDYLCDGTDDQEEIQAAIKAAPAYGEVLLLPGDYHLTGYITVHTGKTLRGCGNGTRLHRDTAEGLGTYHYIIWVHQDSSLLNIEYVDYDAVAPGTYAIIGTQCDTISRIWVRAFTENLFGLSGGNGKETRLTDCRITTISEGQTAISLDSSGSYRIENNYVWNAVRGTFLTVNDPEPNSIRCIIQNNSGSLGCGDIFLDGLGVLGQSIISGNSIRHLEIRRSNTAHLPDTGNLIIGNIFGQSVVEPSEPVIILGEHTTGNFVVGNVLYFPRIDMSFLIQDNGTNNIVRFNSNDTDSGGSSPTTVAQATPAITVSEDGLVTATAVQAAGTVAAGTRSAAHQLSAQDDPSLTPENIRDGVSIFGVAGSMSGGEGAAGVSSFNGRSGAVKPEANDYTAEQVGAATMEQVNAAIQAAILDSWEGSY